MRKGHSSLSDIFYSVLAGGSKGFEIYLARGGNKNIQCSEGRSILMYSIESENVELFDICLRKNVNYNLSDIKDNISLHYAATSNNIYFLTELMKKCKDIDLNCKNYKGITPLMLAVLNNKLESACLLLENGCDPNIRNKDGNTALHLFILSQEIESSTCLEFPLMKTFIKHNADWTIINASYAHGFTPLMCAVNNKDLALVDIILSSCNVQFFTSDLFQLFKKNNQCYKEVLLLKGVNPCSVLDCFQASLTLNDLFCIVQNYAFATSLARNNPLLECCFGSRTKYLRKDLVEILLNCGLQLTEHSTFVKLPEVLMVELQTILKNHENEPVSLKAQTRTFIRRCVRFNVQEKIFHLPLPKSVKKYLLFFNEISPKYSYNVNKYFRHKMILK